MTIIDINIEKPGLVLKEVDWERVPKPFLNIILLQLQQEHPDSNFAYRTYGNRGIILTAFKDTNLATMLDLKAPIEDILTEMTQYYIKPIKGESKADFAWIFQM